MMFMCALVCARTCGGLSSRPAHAKRAGLARMQKATRDSLRAVRAAKAPPEQSGDDNGLCAWSVARFSRVLGIATGRFVVSDAPLRRCITRDGAPLAKRFSRRRRM